MLAKTKDDKGRKFNYEGILQDWWTEADAAEYEKRVAVMVQQANDFTVQGKSVQGKLTSGENIADLGGLRLALRAFQATEQYKENKEIDGFTPMQRFFLAWYVHLYFVLEGRYGLRQCQSRGSHLLRLWNTHAGPNVGAKTLPKNGSCNS